jgi:hypothetical protein
VINYKYNPKTSYIEVKTIIKKPFIKLINKTTKFYTKSGALISFAGCIEFDKVGLFFDELDTDYFEEFKLIEE